MKFFRSTARYTNFDHKWNEEILEEPEVEPVDKKLGRNKRKLSATSNKN